METDKTTEGVVDTTNNEGEGESSVDSITVPKKDYDTLNQTLGSLKKQIKDLKKSQEVSEDESKTSKTNAKPDDNRLLERIEKFALKSANISHPDDVELARNTAKKWGVDLEDVLNDEDFKVKLERQQTSRDNLAATSKIRGGAGTSQAKFTPEYWIAKGVPPTVADVPDRKTRVAIAKAMMANTKTGKKFYND